MDSKSIFSKFENLTVWKQGSKRAPHKPLLALYALSCAIQQDKRLLPFYELNSKLFELLYEFGSPQKTYRPEYPFWRMQKDGLALCTLHHKLFDRGAFTFSEDMKILVSDRANGSDAFNKWLLNYHGQRLTTPNRTIYQPSMSFRSWHVREVFKGEVRE